MANTLAALFEKPKPRRRTRDIEAERIRTRATRAFYTAHQTIRDCKIEAQRKLINGHQSREMNRLIQDIDEALNLMDDTENQIEGRSCL